MMGDEVKIPKHTFGGARLMTDEEKELIREARKALEKNIKPIERKTSFKEIYDAHMEKARAQKSKPPNPNAR